MNPRIAVAMLAALLVATMLISMPRNAAGEPGRRPAEMIILPPDVVKQCEAEGGCMVFSQRRVRELRREAYEDGVKEGGKACSARIL
jgi:hypothetical protein